MERRTWTEQEVQIAVDIYFAMLDLHLSHVPFVKADFNRFAQMHASRSPKSFEMKFMNISAVLNELEMPFVRGYKPMSNYQRILKVAVDSRLANGPTRHIHGLKDLVDRFSKSTRKSTIEIAFAEQIEVEAFYTSEFSVPEIQPRTNQRAESAVVESFNEKLKALGHELKRYKIPLEEGGAPLLTDTFDVTDSVLWEAKAYAGRGEVRLAIGQIFDYQRYLKRSCPSSPRGSYCRNGPTIALWTWRSRQDTRLLSGPRAPG